MQKKSAEKSSIFMIKKSLEERGIMLAYEGPVNQALLTELSGLIRIKLENEANTSIITKVTLIFIEQIQNIMNYSEEKVNLTDSLELGRGICVLGKEDNGYFVMCGNKVDGNQKKRLTEKLDTIATMNKEELKTYYKEQRKKAQEEGSKGAGLGFIDMARKSEKPLEYSFDEIDENAYFFNLKVSV